MFAVCEGIERFRAGRDSEIVETVTALASRHAGVKAFGKVRILKPELHVSAFNGHTHFPLALLHLDRAGQLLRIDNARIDLTDVLLVSLGISILSNANSPAVGNRHFQRERRRVRTSSA